MERFCEICRDFVQIREKFENKTKDIKGSEISYLSKEGYCTECNNLVFVPEFRDENLLELDNAYRNFVGLISVSEIKEILDRYNIGKRPLSTLLGWGEQTLTRYLNGDLPTRQYSDVLKKIYEDSLYMDEILEINKDAISELAYKKCKAAILAYKEICSTKENNTEEDGKIYDVVNYFLLKFNDITPLALQKLLYYSQAFYKVFYGKFLFEDDCEAWVHGPVYRNIYDKYKGYRYNTIEVDDESDSASLNSAEKELLDCISAYLGCYSGKILEKMTHIESPWVLSRLGLEEDENSNKRIDKTLINQYFSDIKKKYNMFNILDIKDYTIDLFEKVKVN
jgi:uncharacterized phage-associated protein